MNLARFGLSAARKVLAFAFEPRTPPERARLWCAGENPTDYGTHIWNARSVECVWTDYQARGVMLTIDIEHGMAHAKPGEAPISAGYCALEMVNGEPWVRFEWSSIGVQMIESGERRYLSPEYAVDPDTKEIVSLTRVSLVAAPGTHHAVILASAKEGRHMDPKAIIEAVRQALGGEGDDATKIATTLAVLDGLSVAVGDGSTTDSTTEPDPAGGGVEAGTGAGASEVQAGSKETPFEASATDEPAIKISAAEKVAAAEKVEASAKSAIQTATDNAVRDVLLTMHADKLDPVLATACKFLPRAQVEKIVASAIQKAGTSRNARPVIGGVVAASGSALERVNAAAPGSALANMAQGMGLRVATAAPSTDERGNFTMPQRTPSEIRAAKLAGKG